MSLLLWLCASFLIVPPIFFSDFGVWMVPGIFEQQWVKIVFLFPIGFGLLWIWFNTGYVIDNKFLKIQYGPFRWKILISEIHSIRETKNPFTAPALSIDKLEINYANFNTIAISPENKNEFLFHLRKLNSNINTENNNFSDNRDI
ncbi:PH domain-containing protein [Fictibacillus halophilus]